KTGAKSILAKILTKKKPAAKKSTTSYRSVEEVVKPTIVRVEPKFKSVELETKQETKPTIEKEKASLKKPTSVPSAVTYDPTLQATFPSISLLDLSDKTVNKGYNNQQLEHMSREVELRLQDFGVDVKVVAVHPGPVVTRFELQLAAGTK